MKIESSRQVWTRRTDSGCDSLSSWRSQKFIFVPVRPDWSWKLWAGWVYLMWAYLWSGDKCDKCQCNSRDTISDLKTNLFPTWPRGQIYFIKCCDLRHERSLLSGVDSGHMPLFTLIPDPARCARSHLVVSLIEERLCISASRISIWINNQYFIYTVPWPYGWPNCIKQKVSDLCYPNLTKDD